MAVTLDEYTTHPLTVDQGITGFANNAYSADWSGTEDIVTAVAGKHIYIESIAISCAVAISLTVGEGETAGAVTAELWGPILFAATGSTFISIYFKRPLKVASATAVVMDASGAGAATVMIQGYIK